MTDTTDTHDAPSPGSYESSVHIMPVPVLLAVFFALIVLTVATVGATLVDLGSWNIWIAMGIATVKATLVALYFMHLRYDRPFNGFLFMIALVFVAIFLSLTLIDTQEYQPDVENRVQSSR